MIYICKSSSVGVRKMEDSTNDYNLMVNWLSNPMVKEYYGGLNNAVDLESIMKKYRPRVLSESPVVACIIEIQGEPEGYIQYYPIKSDEDYDLKNKITIDFSKNNYGIDLFIYDEKNRNNGFGTIIIQLLLTYLFEQKNADEVFIDPQTWNHRAIRCYEKSGFTPIKVIEKRELFDGELRDNLIMSVKSKKTLAIT